MDREAGADARATTRAVDGRRMRLANLSLVLSAVLRHAPVSQSSLVELTGLKKPTVSSLVEELVGLGWIRVEGAAPLKVGRPRQLLAPSPDRGVVVSLQASVDQLAVLVVDFAETPLGRRQVAADVRALDAAACARQLAGLVAVALRDAGVRADQVLGLALGLPGIVGDDGRLVYAPGLRADTLDVAQRLRADLATAGVGPVHMAVENEANLAALAEQRYGVARDVDDFVYLLGERGVGAGVVLDGRLLRGPRGAAGEVGHVSIAVDGPRCPCGRRGCWALYVNEDELPRYVTEQLVAGRASSLSSDGLTVADVLDAAAAGDALAQEALARLRRYLAAGISNLANVYDPRLVVLGGFLTTAFASGLDRLRADVERWLMGSLHADLRLALSASGRDSSLRGGVALVLRHLAAHPRGEVAA